MSYATATDGSRLWFDVAGDVTSSELPLVLIQGFALDHHGWDSAIEDFPGRPIVRLDHRGTGASDDRFPAGWSMRNFAADVIGVLDAAHIPRAHLYGHSMGGRIAQWLGARHSERVAGLVLGATTVGDGTGVARTADASEALASGDPNRLAPLFYPDSWSAAHPEETRRVMPSASPASTQRHLAAVANHDGPDAGRIVSSTLVIHGTSDDLCPVGNAILLSQRIPNSELRLIDGARHVYWTDRPEAHVAVNAFLSQRGNEKGR